MSHALLSHGYYAVDTHRRDQKGARLFELYSPGGELLNTYTGIALEAVLEQMRDEIERREQHP